MTKLKGIILGDAMIPSKGFVDAWKKDLSQYGDVEFAGDWEPDWDKLQNRRLKVEQQGPEIEPVEPLVVKHGHDCNILLGLFIAVSSKVMDAMPNLRIVGVSRGGVENVNVKEATKRGILAFHVMGRNAHAVSDFAIGMMIAENRNIARAFYAIKNKNWQKTFANNGHIMEMHDKTIGIVGFGHIGRLVAQKLAGFNVHILVYDPFVKDEEIEKLGYKPADLPTLFKNSDFVTVHARLTKDNKKMISADLLNMMKPTAYFINTSRAGLIDMDALAKVLQEKKIQGAALDVFNTEPIDWNSPFMKLDNVTLTTHIAGTTTEALTNSPYLLEEDIARFMKGEKPRFILNPEVLDNPDFKKWFNSLDK